MGEQWMLVLFPGGVLGILAVIARFQQGSWLAPGAFFSLFWTIAVAYPLLLSDYRITQGTLWWILALVFAFYVGSSIGDGSLLRPVRANTRNYSYCMHFPAIGSIIMACAILGILSSITNVLAYGYHLTSLLSWEGYIQVARAFTRMRNAGQLILPFVSQLLLVFVYAGPLFAGFLPSFNVYRRNKVLILIILSLIPSIVIAFVQTTRSTIAYAGILFLAGYLSGLVLRGGRRVRLFTVKRAILGLVLISFIGSSFAVLQLVREGDVSMHHIVPKARWLTRNYYTDYLPLYSIWIEDYWHGSQKPSFGAATFAGISNALGIRKRGLSVSIRDVKPGTLRSIVPSLFTGLSQDFTLPGALVGLFLWGMISGLSYRKIAKAQIFYLPILAAFYAVTLWSPIASLLGYNSIIGAFILFSGYVFVTLRKCRSYRVKEVVNG